MSTPTFYTLGFMFDLKKQYVALIQKTHPLWQKGKLNGIGGKKEDGENEDQCMVREFEEETGMQTACMDWINFCTMDFNDCTVYCFKATGNLNELHSTTDEIIQIIPVVGVNYFNTIPNLKWLLPMALEARVSAEITYLP